MNRVRCLVLNAALGPLDYKVPEGMDVGPGSVVECPLGPRTVIGIVWEAERLAGTEVPAEKLRPLRDVLPVPPLSAALRRLIEWTADYYVASLASVARMALSSGGALKGPATMTEYRLTGGMPERMTPQREAALGALEGEQATIRELAGIAGVSEGVLRGLVNHGALEPVEVDCDRPYPPARPDFVEIALSAQQREAADIFSNAVRKAEFAPFLLDGVTGSGKTETYFEPVAQALRMGRQVLVLLPEIALTENFLHRFEERFGAPPVLWHSSLKSTERRRAYRAVSEGSAQVVVGARSALFLPFARLGLIVVDEAHETSFKQEEGVRYNARDVAVMRGHFEQVPVVLASATPALESLQMAESGIYAKIDLPSRYGGAQMPTIETIDLTEEKPPQGMWLAQRLVDGIEARLERGEQSLLFLNRRGYAPLTLCRACGHQIGCKHCDARMVEHRFLKRLMCHQCGETAPMPETCPNCEVAGKLAAVGPGVERITEEAQALFPDARVTVLSSDLFGSARALKARILEIAEGAADIVVGTQLVAKGHNFPKLTLVGVIDSDLGLQGSDLRAAERTFQLMRQVAGRAGRSEARGTALLQSFQPEHPVIRAILSGDEEGFWAAEAAARRAAGVPPYGRMAGIVISSPDMQQAFDLGNRLARLDAPLRRIGAQLFGPAPAPIARVRGRHRVRLLVKAEKTAPLQAALAQWAAQVKVPANARLAIDIDPQSFL